MAFEVTIKGDTIAADLATARQVIARKTVIPVLSHALIDVKKGKLTLTASDIDVTYRCEINADGGAGSGTVTADIEALLGLTKSFGGDPVKLSFKDDEKVLRIQSAGFKGQLQTMSPDDFPSFPKVPSGAGVTVPRAALFSGIKATQFAILHTVDTRYFLNGMLIDLKKDGSAVAASDGKRVAVWSIEGVQPSKPIQAIVPLKGVSALKTMVDGEGEDVVVHSGENHQFFTIGSRMLVTRIVDGNFPPYERLMPEPGKEPIEISRDRLIVVLRRVLHMSDASKRGVVLSLTPNSLTVASEKADLGQAQEAIDVEYNGPDVTFGCDATYLREFAEASHDETLRLSLGSPDPSKHAMLWQAGSEYRYVLAPMSL